jgi:nitrous oxidase accessory protein NosD
VKGLGDIAFVASVGDVWQHQTKVSDEEHSLRGIIYTPNPIIESMVKVTPETLTIEAPIIN